MKKFLGLAALAFTLVACGTTYTQTTTQTTTATTTVAAVQTATLNITKDGDPIEGSPFTVTFKDGDNLLDVMAAQLQIVEKDGFISAINGIEQEPTNNKYWLFDVNQEMSPVGAKEVLLKQGDIIDWKLEALN